MKRIYLIIFLALCGLNHSMGQKTNSSDSVLALLEENTPVWLESWGGIEKLELEKKGRVKDITIRDLIPLSEDYQEFLFYNESATKYIDIYSYGVDIEIRGSDTIVYFAGECKAILTDLTESVQYELLQYGSVGSVDYGFWISEDRFCMMGSEETEEIKFIPVVWLYDLASWTFERYIGEERNELNSTFFSRIHPGVIYE